jgi:YD repeat-containing protein
MSFSYNNRDLIESVTKGTCQDNPVSLFAYDGNGNVTHTTNPLNNSQTYAYDGFDRVRSVKDPLNNETVFFREQFGSRLTVKNLDGSGNLLRETVTLKDLVGRVTSYTIKVPEGEDVNYTYNYANNGKTVTITDPLGGCPRIELRISKWDKLPVFPPNLMC